MVLDGRVHNSDELSFSGSDAEGFLALFRRLGFEGALRAVNGDLAVAVHDSTADRLWLGRDRVGNKPLYWAPLPDGGIAFASQPRGLLAVDGVDHAVDREYVALVAGGHYRCFDNDRAGSPYVAIAQLPAGHLLEAGPSARSVRSYPVPQVDTLFSKVAGYGLDDPAAAPAWQQLSELIFKDLAMFPQLTFRIHGMGYNKGRVGKMVFYWNQLGDRSVDPVGTYIRKG